MVEIAVPPIERRPELRAIIVGAYAIAGETSFSVTAYLKAGRPPRRWWFPYKALAWSHALELADTYSLALLDLTSSADPEA